MGRVVFVVWLLLSDQPPPHHGGGVQALPGFEGSFLFMHTPFDAELPNFTYI